MAPPPSPGRIGAFRPAVAPLSEQTPFHVEQYQPGPPLPWPAKQPLTTGERAYLIVVLIASCAVGLAVSFASATPVARESIGFFGFVCGSLFFIFFIFLLGYFRSPAGGRCPSCLRYGALGLLERHEVHQLQLRFGKDRGSPDLATMHSQMVAKLRETEQDVYFDVNRFGKGEAVMTLAVTENRRGERQAVFRGLNELAESWGPRPARWKGPLWYRECYGCKRCGRKWIYRSFPSAD